MLLLFNRKELAITYDLKKQSEIRTLLQNNGIKYDVKTKNLLSPSPMNAGSRAHSGSLDIDLTKAYEYKIYVSKSDYERAVELLRTEVNNGN